MNIKTIGWLATAFCTVCFAEASSRSAAAETPAPTPTAQAEAPTTVTVLGYDSVGGGKATLTTEEFTRQMEKLRTAGMVPISLQDFQSWRTGEKKLPANAVLLTFENAGNGFMTNILPILKKHGYPFLLFVDMQSLGSKEGYITKEDLSKITAADGNVGVQAHVASPAKKWQEAELLGTTSINSLAENELGKPARLISEICGTKDITFSHFSDRTDVTLLRELVRSGFVMAFSHKGGKASQDSPGYMLPRYMVAGSADFTAALGLPETPAASVADLEDDVVAIDDEEEASTDKKQATATTQTPEGEDEAEPELEKIPTTPVTPTYANLGKRTPAGDWVTASFTQPVVPREQTSVAVLGYHNFSNTKSVTEMLMRTHVFCQQMQYIKEAGLAVISMQDFLEWRFGTRQLPERCVLITIDDGWKSVYTDAYPVLKAYGYPFTLFLYTRYIDVQGDSMKSTQIKEMQQHGATIGSHSTNHLYPRSWRRLNKKPEQYTAQVKTEILDSRVTLEGKFGTCSTYCYPGGYNTPQMIEALKASPYRAAFTVLEKKVTCKEAPYQVHRYMVFGNDHKIFRRAVNFDGVEGIKPTEEGIAAAAATAREFFPAAFQGIAEEAKEAANTSDAAAADATATPAPEAGGEGTADTENPAPADTSSKAKASNKKGGKKRKR